MNNLIGILKIKFFEGPLTLRRPQYPQFGAESSTACPGSWARGPHDAWSYPPRNTEEEGSPSDIFEEIVASWLSIVIQIQLYSINYTRFFQSATLIPLESPYGKNHGIYWDSRGFTNKHCRSPTATAAVPRSELVGIHWQHHRVQAAWRSNFTGASHRWWLDSRGQKKFPNAIISWRGKSMYSSLFPEMRKSVHELHNSQHSKIIKFALKLNCDRSQKHYSPTVPLFPHFVALYPVGFNRAPQQRFTTFTAHLDGEGEQNPSRARINFVGWLGHIK